MKCVLCGYDAVGLKRLSKDGRCYGCRKKALIARMKISPEDVDLLDNYLILDGMGYAEVKFSRRKLVLLHRIIAERMHGKLTRKNVIDHVNHDTLDNRRENLRLTTTSGNMQNRKDNTYRGTTFHKQSKKWLANVFHQGKLTHLGLFKDRDDAANAAKKKREELGFLSSSLT